MCRPPSMHAPVRTSPILLKSGDSSPEVADEELTQNAEQKSSKRQLCPEFLRKLVDMLQDEMNSSIIEWKDNNIYVYDPHAMCEEVLPKYFRHSKYSSFQRQLNYFGFRKTEGKGKMTPCVYSSVELQGKSVSSILDMKRKINVLDGRKVGKAELALQYSAIVDAPPTIDYFDNQVHLPGALQPSYDGYYDPFLNAPRNIPFDKQEVYSTTSSSSPAFVMPKPTLNSFELTYADLVKPEIKTEVQGTFVPMAMHQQYQQPVMMKTLSKPIEPLSFNEGADMLDSLIDEWVNSCDDSPDAQIQGQTSAEEEVVWDSEEQFFEDVALAFF